MRGGSRLLDSTVYNLNLNIHNQTSITEHTVDLNKIIVYFLILKLKLHCHATTDIILDS